MLTGSDKLLLISFFVLFLPISKISLVGILEGKCSTNMLLPGVNLISVTLLGVLVNAKGSFTWQILCAFLPSLSAHWSHSAPY